MPWIERVLTSQPLDADVGIDWSNPITSGLVVSGYGLSTGDKINNPSVAYGKQGVATEFSAISNQYIKHLMPLGTISSIATLVFVGRRTGNTENVNTYISVGGASTNQQQLYSSGTNTVKMLTRNSSGTGALADSSTSVTTNADYILVGRSISPTLRDIWVNGLLKNTNTTAITASAMDTITIGSKWYNGTIENTSDLTGQAYGYAVFNRALTDDEVVSISANPWQLFKKERIWVPVAASGGSTITQADGTSTTGSLGGSATVATTPTQADGTSTAASIAGGSTAAAGVTQADGTSTAATLGGSAVNAAVITQADGTSTASSLGGSATAATTPAAADGTSTAASIAASATAAAAVTQADGASTASTLGGSAVNAAVITQADAATTASTLTGAGLTAGASSITAASGTSTAATLAGSSVAASTVTQADGVSTAGTLTGTDGIAAASIFPASGSSTASDFAASATAASVAIAAAGASSAATMAGSDGASTFTGPARTRIGAVTLHAKTTTMTLRATNARIGSLTP